MPDLERRAITRFSLSVSEFWDSTPRELELLMEQFDYNVQLEMNQVRHIMASITNTVVDRKKRPQGYKPSEIMYLPLLDGSKISKEDELDAAKAALKRFKTKDAS